MQHILPEVSNDFFQTLESTWFDPKSNPKSIAIDFRRMMENLFRELTRDEPRAVSNHLNNRSVYIFETYQSPDYIVDAVHGFRNFGNRFAHNANYIPTSDELLTALKTICEVISHFASGQVVPLRLAKIYEHHPKRFTSYKKTTTPLKLYDFKGVVLHLDIPIGENALRFCTIVCETEDFGTVQVRCWNDKKNNPFSIDWTELSQLVRPYSTIAFLKIKKSEEQGNSFSTTNQTLVVIEPDYLIEVKDIADSYNSTGSNANIQLLKKFEQSTSNDKMMVGIAVGYVLDDVITEGSSFNFQKSFKRFAKANAFPLISLANQEGGGFNVDFLKEKILKPTESQVVTIQTFVEGLEDWKKTLEPTFISAKYGIHGRLDTLLEHTLNENRKDVIEMKSGRVPVGELHYPQHEAQAFLYTLLLEEVFPNRQGLTAIFYSQAKVSEKSLRDVNETLVFKKQQLMMLRNRIVANEMRLANGDMSPLQNLTFSKAGDMGFSKQMLLNFENTLQNSTPLERAYFHHYCGFIYRELKIAKIGLTNTDEDNWGFSALWRRNKSAKIQNYDVLVDLIIKDIDDDFKINLVFDKRDLDLFSTNKVSVLRESDIVILYPTPDPEELDPLKFQILKGTIEQLTTESVRISLNNKQLDKSHFNLSKYWAIEKDFRDRSYKLMLQSLFDFISSKQVKRDLILGLKRPTFAENVFNGVNTEGSIGNQSEVIQKALCAKDYFLIQGPPGTGKTSKVLTEIVATIYRQEENILVVAFTNQAVKEICAALQNKSLNFIRLGRGGEEYCFQTMATKCSKLQELHAKITDTRIFVSTQATILGQTDLFSMKNFSTVIVDEASQLVEPQIVSILTKCERFILIGDEKQLPAVVQQSEEESLSKSDELHAIGLETLRESLFYRLLKNAEKQGWNDCYAMLTHHHRMHEDVAAYINSSFYDNKLQIATPSAQKAQNAIRPVFEDDFMGKSLSRSRMLFIPSLPEKSSKVNEAEAQHIVALIRYIAENYVLWYGEAFDDTKHLGVITPFRAQIAKIRQILGKDFLNLRIDTVERFQGSERDIILVSYAVRNTRQLENLCAMTPDGKVDRKLNVALSRAKKHIVVVGCPTILSHKETFRGLLQHIEDAGGYVAWKNNSKILKIIA